MLIDAGLAKVIPLALLCLSAFALSWAITALLKEKLIAKKIMDTPNERSMHETPVPRGGGIAVMTTIIAGMLFYIPSLPVMAILPLLGALALLLAVSWADDKSHIHPAFRLALHLMAAGLGCLALGENVLLFGGFVPVWLDRVVMLLGWGWFMNLYNFMDGIDGITGTQTICCALSAGLILSTTPLPDAPFLLALCALLAGACLGFLMLNWHKAKIFLGDVGSVPLGFLVGFLLLKIATMGTAYLLPALLIPLYYLADSGITMTKRLLRREKIWQAHREHFYQRAALGEKSPVPVVLWIVAANVGFGASAFLALNDAWLGGILGVTILVLLLAKMNHSARKAS